MKIAFSLLDINKNSGGLYEYSYAILKILLELDELEKITILCNKDQQESVKAYVRNEKVSIKIVNVEQNKILKLLIDFSKFINLIIEVHPKIPKFFRKISNIINPYTHILNSLKVDVVHFPKQTAPAYKITPKIIVTLHDLQELHFPEFFTSQERIDRAIHFKMSINNSDSIIVSYQHIKNDILKYFKMPDEKVIILKIPFTTAWVSEVKKIEFKAIQKKYELPDDYLLYPAQTWPHKNHKVLLNAINLLNTEGNDIKLVCTGNKTDYYSEISETILKLGLEKNIFFLGLVEKAELVCLYKHSKLVVIPTLYEAGSGPLVEAMFYGSPVICSNVTSLPETISDNKYLFPPNDVKNLADLIKRMLTNEEFRIKNIENSIARIRQMDDNANIKNDLLNIYERNSL